ncbi:MAG TPA: adenylate/guanylate cyclase domain-containing protein [Candidatus Limnocylindrales bacterium]|nr:adenylate/guanylate cyclase domain-containing protein [Candidatus Limnocylindrales bacterium]
MVDPPLATAAGASPFGSVAALAGPAAAPAPPVALSSFLITDIEGSTRLWEEQAAAMAGALALHDALLRAAVEGHGGTVIKTTGDGLLAVFGDPTVAIAAALDGQRALRDATWGETGPLRVRMAIHSGTAETRDGDYFGPVLNRSARILAIGHGGQILVSSMTAALVAERLGGATSLVDLGSHRLRDLDRPEQVFQVSVADLPLDFPPLRSLSTGRTNLPVQLTSFIGRERELAEVQALVARHRLVTLIGTGGTGKTRLMLEAAGRLAERYADGTWLAELAPLADPAQVASEIARALGAPEVPGQPALSTVLAFLADKEVLLLLDNAEHLVETVAEIAERLLSAAPGLRVLATSREALAVAGEAVYQLRSLSCPAPAARHPDDPAADDVTAAAGTEAVRLFLDRATTVDPEFALADTNVSSVSEICRRLDGIPLAIELAAARVSVMSPDEIAKRLGDRFRLLAGGRRTAVPRQQTLHALIDWSWDLLTEDDRILLRRLSIFAGGWTIGRAARIVGDGDEPLDEIELQDRLTRLIDRSLVIVDRGATTRYRMLETIRQYAREKLIEAGEVQGLADRHFRAFAALVAMAEPELRGAGMVDWLDRMDSDVENLDAALEWGLESMPWEAVRMATALLAYWAVRVPSADSDARLLAAIEIARRQTLGRPAPVAGEQAQAALLLGEAARMWAMGGRAQTALGWANDAVSLAEASGDVQARLAALGGLAVAATFTGGRPDLVALFQEGVTLAGEHGTWWMLAMAAGFAGASLATTDVDGGRVLVGQAEAAAAAAANPFVLGAVAMAHGRLFGQLGETDAAAERFTAAIARFTEIGDEQLALAARSDLGHALRRGRRFAEAAAIYRDTIGGWVHLGHRGAVASQLENFGYMAMELGNVERAVRLIAAAQAIRDASSQPRAFDEQPEHETMLQRAQAELEPAAFDSAWDAGQRLSQTEAVALARAD